MGKPWLRLMERQVSWKNMFMQFDTVTFDRRKHKKGQEEEQAKKRTRRTQKFSRPIVGASITDIMAKKNMKPEVRKAQREQAIRAAKEQKKAVKAAKKVQAPPKTKAVPKQKASKVQPKSAPRVGGKR
ncbi:hypothetical protein Cfor_12231 [Coptotermes formosanus]|uniref:60S ribosomal protein L24 n=1 Tax=Coptotermes formosanus TaxID=36987 RepID=A0A6L2QB82_COPFO|nr:hypothetical protein Cfor_12231 [Coptotermes formosanus]